ncbi:16S rRNA (guanine(527)-N(7))-methyltransferase RsmG [Vannielia litorea]|uniref:Ribosomal RNA small subunit methyltransferase G n=1 Tax=Vannielia litorea TaxID=1217970 RepID=A0A1N6HJM5_9RHOB|nr:16S rRNA (guanine(527)-N(7))-methyltransferase RsmG [Vannielia litorea]SIO19937.1 16S rRNA m(7)G-527 methyltransferase [Vannielia litorea]
MTAREEVLVRLDVSRETCQRLDTYAALLAKWNKAINLVAPATLPDLWRRHFLDSAQVLQHGPTSGLWLDIGTGGGFPGLVCAILAADSRPELTFEFVESDQRKCTFLATVLRETGITASIHSARVEALEPRRAQALSARALAPLTALLDHAERHLARGGIALFLKGAQHDAELAKALEKWAFDVQKHPSETDPTGALLTIGNITRV